MNYYPHHIGDYDSNTAHLTWAEDMAYTRLIRLYYRTELPLPADNNSIYRLVRATSKPEKQAVVQVLNEFFILLDDGWHNARCDAEIEKAKAKADRNREVGKYGGRPRKTETKKVNSENLEITQMVSENNPNITLPITNNQKPITNNQITTHTESEEVQPAKPSLAAAVCVLLKSEGIGSVNPQNPTLVNLIQDGADIGMFAEAARISKSKGKGFAYVLGVVKSQLSDAAHVAAQARDSPSKPNETAYQRSVRERVEEATGRRKPDDRTVIDITPGQTQTARLA